MNTQQHILVVSSNAASLATLSAAIAAGGYFVSHAAVGGDAMMAAFSPSAHIDLVLIDAELTDMSGVELVAGLRRQGLVVPVMLAIAADDEDEIVQALDAGANDVAAYPLRGGELLARLRVQLRAATKRAESEIHIGPAVFRPEARIMLHPDVPRQMRLTEKEAALLLRLCRAGGRPVPRNVLLSEVWGYSPETESHTVETHVYRLRRKLEPTASSPVLLLNERNGYRLCLGEVRERRAARTAQVRVNAIGRC